MATVAPLPDDVPPACEPKRPALPESREGGPDTVPTPEPVATTEPLPVALEPEPKVLPELAPASAPALLSRPEVLLLLPVVPAPVLEAPEAETSSPAAPELTVLEVLEPDTTPFVEPVLVLVVETMPRLWGEWAFVRLHWWGEATDPLPCALSSFDDFDWLLAQAGHPASKVATAVTADSNAIDANSERLFTDIFPQLWLSSYSEVGSQLPLLFISTVS